MGAFNFPQMLFCIFDYEFELPFIKLNGSEFPNIFKAGSEKQRKLAKSLKIFSSATGEQKPVI
jgi:hypothetical protein